MRGIDQNEQAVNSVTDSLSCLVFFCVLLIAAGLLGGDADLLAEGVA
jgi:hypothetical protein